jgi:tetratricopeptide (TPR) repeat protein
MDAAANAAASAPLDLRDNILNHLAARVGTLGIRLSNLGRREEALAASQEAVDIRRRLAQTRPDAFLPDLATSLNNSGAMLSNLGRREEALAASQEAVDIRRRLAQTRPDAFLPDLATSISVMSDVLAALDRHEEAARAATQALEILAPFVERYSQTYQGLAGKIRADILRYCEAAGRQPDNALLARVARALGTGDAIKEDSAIVALKAKIGAILEAAEKSGTLDEVALAELPAELVDQLRTVWAGRAD